MQLRTRFAPSPTGLLHVGNAYSALCCAGWAEANQAELLLRIEDIDHGRCRAEFVEAILSDLRWLGLAWPEPVRRQSQCLTAYRQAIAQLRDMDMIYPCFCSRKSIRQEIERIGIAPHAGDYADAYPGLCRNLCLHEQEERMSSEPFAWRLHARKALQAVADKLCWIDASGDSHSVHVGHDIVIGRKDIAFSYHLSVVVDDAAQQISHVIRGRDLLPSTGLHCLLQSLLGLPRPVYLHHPLLLGPDGERLAKRHRATTLRSLRAMGVNPQRLRDCLLHGRNKIWPFEATDSKQILARLG
jgi:glutamyl-Q tRNA(Asp) synthetase